MDEGVVLDGYKHPCDVNLKSVRSF